ncbi:nitrilase-related carbon-nitrogen hydrolase [Chloroflexota bacterium]
MKLKTNIYPLKDRWSYLWLLLGGLLTLFSNGRLAIPLAIWLGNIFIIRFMRTQKAWRGFILVSLTMFVTVSLAAYGWMFWVPLGQYLMMMAVNALTICILPFVIDRWLTQRVRGFSSTLIFPLAATALEFLSISGNPMGTVGASPYTQYGNLALVQIISLTGMWGLNFLMCWLASIVNWAWENRFEWKKIGRGVAVYSGIMLLVVVYGSARLAFAPSASETVRMHGITMVDMREEIPNLLDARRQDWQAFRQMSAGFQERYLEATIEQAEAGAEVVHWPELALWVPEEDEAGLLQRSREIAQQYDLYLVLPYGVIYPDDRKTKNKLVMLDSGGQIVLEHKKYGGAMIEGNEPGDGILHSVETPFGKVTAVICADTNFPAAIRQVGHLDADILFSPSLEVSALDPYHAHMAAFRAIENGVTVVRQADNGLSVVIDPYGRIIASVDHFQSGERLLVAQVPAKAGVFTLYPIIGDLFAWLTVAALAAIMVVALFQGLREKRSLAAAQKQVPAVS